jgi:hypothetical protein
MLYVLMLACKNPQQIFSLLIYLVYLVQTQKAHICPMHMKATGQYKLIV